MLNELARRARILVVSDDETSTARTIRTAFARMGFEAVEAAIGNAAAARVRRWQPHVLVYLASTGDLLEPDSFHDLADAVRETASSLVIAGVPADPAREALFLARGADDVMSGTPDLPILVAKVTRHAERRVGERILADRVTSLEGTVAERTKRWTEAVDLLRRAEGELRRARAVAETTSQEHDASVAHLAHELRTPLNAVIGFADAMKCELLGPLGHPRYHGYANDIHQAGQHMLALIDGLLRHAKTEAETQSEAKPLEVSEVDLAVAVKEGIRLLEKMAEQGGVELCVEIRPGLQNIRTDVTKLRQILLNLVSNAIKFTPRGGSVYVEVGPDGDRKGAYVLIVRDTGIGIAAQDMGKVMQPYGQVAAAQQPDRPRGVGLGLPLTKRFVEMLGGTLDIESVPGGGTTVIIRLPEAPPGHSEAEAA